MNTQQVAIKVVELTRKQAWREALDTLYADDIVSVEARALEGSPESHGIEAVRAKVDWWINEMECHSVKVDGPYVAHDHFALRYDLDVTDRKSGHRMQLAEIGFYTVKDDKIVREEFLPYSGQEQQH